jgi:hypothetical protein
MTADARKLTVSGQVLLQARTAALAWIAQHLGMGVAGSLANALRNQRL